MANREEAPYVIVRLHTFLLCGRDTEKTALLDKLIYLSSQRDDLFSMLEEEIALGNINTTTDLEGLRGWITKSASELCALIFIASSPRNISRKLRELIDCGLLLEKPDVIPGQKVTVRPNIGLIKSRLADLGYTLKGGIISEMIEGVEDKFNNPTKAAELVTPAEEFAGIPGAKITPKSKGKSKENAAKELLDEQTWIRKQRKLELSPDYIKHVAYVVYVHTGFEPEGGQYIAGLSALYKACGGNDAHLIQGLKDGEKARKSALNPKGVTLTGPRSYQGYVRSAVAQSNKPIDVTESKPTINQPQITTIGAMNGQKIEQKNGKVVIDMGGSRRAA